MPYLIAGCFPGTGQAAAALQAARDLLPELEGMHGPQHPDTLAIH